MILEFERYEDAAAFILALDALAVQRHGLKGYDIWDDISGNLEGTYYIASPSGDTRFEGWQEVISFVGVEREFPSEWRLTGPDVQ